MFYFVYIVTPMVITSRPIYRKGNIFNKFIQKFLIFNFAIVIFNLCELFVPSYFELNVEYIDFPSQLRIYPIR